MKLLIYPKFYTGSLMTTLFFYDIVVNGMKQDYRSGKERQCCRYIRIITEI